jgi:hypothetical protein
VVRRLRFALLPLGLPVGRLTVGIAVGVFAVACLAGLVRALPLLMAPGVPAGLAPAVARGVVGVALEAALFVAPPIAAALGAARFVERGEARALHALGVPPAGLLLGAWPVAAAVALASGLAVASWGREAAAPGRLVREMLVAARTSCEASSSSTMPASAVEVPLLDVAWVCFPGAPPRLVGALAGGSPALLAGAIDVSDDLRTLTVDDLTVALPPAEPGGGPTQLRAAHATVHGLLPAGRGSNLSPAARVAVLTGSSIALAGVAAWLALRGVSRTRPLALAMGAAGPLAALLVFSAFERVPTPPFWYAAVPAAGVAATMALALLLRAR